MGGGFMQLLKYGLKDGCLAHIDTVSNGLSCGCTCPSCGGKLEAHQGEKNQHHFKHYNATDCEHGSESALHIMAKNIIANTKTVYIPDAPSNIYDQKTNGKCYKFENAYIEKSISPEIRCDVLLESGNVILNVEIKVTHEVDSSKKWKLYNHNLRTIEIDLSYMVNDFNESTVRNAIERGTKTQLIYSPKAKEIYAKWWLGEWKEIFHDRTGHPYVKKCRYAKSDEITYFMAGDVYRSKHSGRECHGCCGGFEFDENQKCFLCRGLYGNLNYEAIEQIIEVRRKNNIVQYAELIINGEKTKFGIKS